MEGGWHFCPSSSLLELALTKPREVGLTLWAWVKVPAAVNPWSTLIGKEVSGAYQGFYTLMVHDGSSGMGSDHAVTSWVANGSSIGNLSGAPNGVSAGQWHQIGITCDTTWLTLYLDGQVDGVPASMNGTAPITTFKSDLIFGISQVFPGRGFAGDVDEIAIWDAALTPNEMLYLYQNGIPVPPPACQDLLSHDPADLNQDCYINLEDFVLLAKEWFLCSDPQNSECVEIP